MNIGIIIYSQIGNTNSVALKLKEKISSSPIRGLGLAYTGNSLINMLYVRKRMIGKEIYQQLFLSRCFGGIRTMNIYNRNLQLKKSKLYCN